MDLTEPLALASLEGGTWLECHVPASTMTPTPGEGWPTRPSRDLHNRWYLPITCRYARIAGQPPRHLPCPDMTNKPGRTRHNRALGKTCDDVPDRCLEGRVTDLQRRAGADEHDVGIVTGEGRVLRRQRLGRLASRVLEAAVAQAQKTPRANTAATAARALPSIRSANVCWATRRPQVCLMRFAFRDGSSLILTPFTVKVVNFPVKRL
jgi:hypothetical protein